MLVIIDHSTQKIGLRDSNSLAELTKSMVRDLSRGRSLTVSIDRFKNYCTASMGKWFTSLLFVILLPFFFFV